MSGLIHVTSEGTEEQDMGRGGIAWKAWNQNEMKHTLVLCKPDFLRHYNSSESRNGLFSHFANMKIKSSLHS